MTQYAARFKQSPAELKRYVLDFSLDLAPGENVSSVVINVVYNSGPIATPLVVNSVALLPPNAAGQTYGFAFFVSGGSDTSVYEVQFLVTTSLTQVLEEVVLYTLSEKL
jgi:hypothetical protein